MPNGSENQSYENQMRRRGPQEQRYFNLMMTMPMDKLPSVHGVPRRDMSTEEYYRILADALERGQNVLFSSATQNQSAAMMPVYARPSRGFVGWLLGLFG